MNLWAWLVWAIPLAAAPVIPVVGAVEERACKWAAVAVGGATAGAAILLAAGYSAPGVESLAWVPSLGVSLQVQVDGLSVLLSVFVALLSFAIIVYAAGNMAAERAQARFYALVLLFVGGMLGLLMAGNLVQLYAFWEVVGICSAFLIAFWNENPKARQAGIKAFVVTRFGDAALLLAVVLILASIGTTSLGGVAAAAADPAAANWTLIGFLVLLGAMGKSAQVPLHVWLPDAMEGPTPVSALIHAATMVNAGVYLLIRMYPVLATSQAVLDAVLAVGLVSMVLGAACACAATDLKRVLAYSTISQLGLMFAAVGLGSWEDAAFHVVSQGLFKALAFMAAGSVIEAAGTREMDQMRGLRAMKVTYVSFLAASLAMVGLPPLIGFWTKDAILSYSLSVNSLAFGLIVAASVLTAFYSFRAVFKVFNGQPGPVHTESSPLMTGPMVALVAGIALGWLVLDGQGLLPFSGPSLNVLAIFASFSALGLGLGTAYAAFGARYDAAKVFEAGHPSVGKAAGALLGGLGFDAAYARLSRAVTVSLSSASLDIQTGELETNVGLLLLALLALILLVASGVV